MSLNDILKGKVIKPVDSKSAGILILKAEAWAQANSFILSVRYFDLNNQDNGLTEDRDLLTITVNDFINQYEICNNSDKIENYKQATFENMEVFLTNWLEGKI